MADELDRDQLERIRSKAYAIVQSDPGGPNADQARRILSKLPKNKVGQGFEQPGLPKERVHGELPSADIDALPPTPDEQAGLPNELAKPPLASRAAAALLSPSTRREFIRGADKMITAGVGQRVGNAIGTTFDKDPEHDFEKTAASDAAESPMAGNIGELAGLLSGRGFAGLASKLGSKAGGLVSSRGTGLLGKTISGGAGGALANAVALPIIAGGQQLAAPTPDANTGDSLQDRIKGRLSRTGEAMKNEVNPINLAAGFLLGAPSGTARGIRESGQVGRDIRLVEGHGASATPLGPRGGIYEAPLMRDVEGTAREQGQMSRTVADKVLAGIDEDKRALSQKYASDKASADAQGFLEGKINTDAIRQDAEKLISGASLTSSERAAVQREVIDELSKYPSGMSVDEFNDFRGKLGRIFGVGPGETSIPALDTLRQSAKRTVDETEMGPINEAYSKGRQRLDRQHEQLGISENSRRDRQARSLANSIDQRSGQERTAGIRSGGIEETPGSAGGIDQFLKENPRYQQLFDLPELLAAKERMTPGIEPEAGFHRRMGHSLLHKNLEPAMVGLYRLGRPLEKGSVPAALAAQMLLNGGTQ